MLYKGINLPVLIDHEIIYFTQDFCYLSHSIISNKIFKF